MSQQLRTIRLYGKLGTRFGRIHHYAVSSIREAIKAMCVTLPGFERELMNSRDYGVAYAIFLGKRNLNESQLGYPLGKEDIRIAPIIQGRKAGTLQTIFGAVLVIIGAIGAFTPFGQAFGGAAWGPYLMAMGGSMMAGGILQMLSPQQGGLSSKDTPQNTANYNFNGPLNIEAQGNPEPLLYGEFITGSVVISGGIYAEDQSSPSGQSAADIAAAVLASLQA